LDDSNEKVLKELRIANLLKTIEMSQSDDEDDPIMNKKRHILRYIFNIEMANLQLDSTLFPKKNDVSVKNWRW